MARSRVEDNPAFRRLKGMTLGDKYLFDAKIAEHEKAIAELRIKKRNAFLNAVWRAKRSGLSDYAIGKATGVTSSDAKRKLFAEVAEYANEKGLDNGAA